MKIFEVTEAHEASPQQRKLAALGRTLMDMSAKMPMKGASDEEIGKSNKMAALGDALTRFGTPFGPRDVKGLVKASGVEPKEIQEFLAMAQKAGPVKPVAAEPEPEDDEDDDFDGPSDDEIARQADMKARRGK